ncbi:MAG TPA: ornithine carbamoyltransferase [Bacillota bacterium]
MSLAAAGANAPTPSGLDQLRGSDFLTVSDVTADQLHELLDLAAYLKKERPRHGAPLAGKHLALIFAKPSTRTRVSFELAMRELGGDVLVLFTRDMQIGRGETLEDTGAVLSRYVSAIAMRTFAHSDLETLAHAATVPVINMLSDRFHPCQALADMLTLKERFGRLEGLRLAYIGDGNNVAHSLIEAGVMLGVNVVIASPPGYEPDAGIVALARQLGGRGSVEIVHDVFAAVKDADAIYTDTWTSMGAEAEAEQRHRVFAPYQVNAQLCAAASSRHVFMHCLPAHRGQEVTDEVIDGEHSVVFDQAENRLHAQKALLWALLVD